jgi:mono/diheme cytochrome c family protein
MSIRENTPRATVVRVLGALLAVAALAVLAGCDLQENADREKGRTLFQQKCGTCHALAEAGTAAQVGPNLDDAFAVARKDGMDQDTIEGVVKAQVENPRPANPSDVDTYMPPGLVEGQDLEDVSSYVGSVAGIPGIKPPKLPAPELFAQQCGICHKLQAAGTTATTGPALDEVLPGQSDAEVKQDIVDPNAMIAAGYGPGIMPSNFSQTLTEEDINGLVQYLQQSVGNSK